ncbi:hypothetical protein SAMN02746065_1365 [Desulfocicer vacuolatum DSM 3385]|uniref:Uncharacterized protein n=3 Tax=Desulfocicer vacuolatum TaxID=2298 RepID=A0A1W2ENW3_9BACT|nr:hypothetical protein [Desulfocicer vacuolatum]SMD10956.1 hypothetical protein SAMN02746065_1365 [Desulfocicer vacuolatum DSM 3385]
MPDGDLMPLTRHKPDTTVENGYKGATKTMGFIARQWGSPSVEEKKNQHHMTTGETPRSKVKAKGTTMPVLSILPMATKPPVKLPEVIEQQTTGPTILTCDSPGDPPLDLDMFLTRLKTHMFSISCMAFQDVWNVDLERVKDCCIHVLSPQGKLIPFCMYNLTDVQGKSLYRKSPMINKERC